MVKSTIWFTLESKRCNVSAVLPVLFFKVTKFDTVQKSQFSRSSVNFHFETLLIAKCVITIFTF